jgi:plasmid stabilization system protein ParE
MSFFLMFVIMAVATDTRAVGEAAAIAIGGTVGLDAMFGGPISGASMNPMRSAGPALVSGDLHALWLYIVAPLAGAALGRLPTTSSGTNPPARPSSPSSSPSRAERSRRSACEATRSLSAPPRCRRGSADEPRPGVKRPARSRQEAWRLYLNLSVIGFAGSLLLALIGAWLAAALAFAFGLLSALLSGWLLRAGARTPRPSAGAAPLRVRKERRR